MFGEVDVFSVWVRREGGRKDGKEGERVNVGDEVFCNQFLFSDGVLGGRGVKAACSGRSASFL